MRLDKRRMDFFWGRVIVSHEYEKKKGRLILIGWRRGKTALMAQAVEKDGEK